MTEATWLTTATQPMQMCQHVMDRLPSRKLLLLACAACRATWLEFDGPLLAETIDAVERHADGTLSDADYFAVRDRFLSGIPAGLDARWDFLESSPAVVIAVFGLVSGDVRGACMNAVTGAERGIRPDDIRWPAPAIYKRQICDRTREVVGNPFRPWKAVPGFLGGGLVQPDGRTVPVSAAARGLAEGIAADLGFDRLPILADALEEGGVTDAELLAHCRRSDGHVRGCWAVDVVLGR